MKNISPERQKIAEVFKKHIENAMVELGGDYEYNLQGEFNKTPIKISVEVLSKNEIP
jgi:hypothetical protein